MTARKIAPSTNKANDPVSNAVANALATMVGVVESMALSAAAQVTSGSEAVVGGQAAEGGVSAQQGSSQQHTGASHKNDVSAPEIVESYNLSGLNDNSHIGKVNARTFDMVSAILTTTLAGHVNSMNQQSANTTVHADEEFSARKRVTEIGLITVGDATEEAANDTDR